MSTFAEFYAQDAVNIANFVKKGFKLVVGVAQPSYDTSKQSRGYVNCTVCVSRVLRAEIAITMFASAATALESTLLQVFVGFNLDTCYLSV